MRLSSHNPTRRFLITGTVALTFAALVVALTFSGDGSRTHVSGRDLAPAVVGAPTGVAVAADRGATVGSSNMIADAVSSVVRTGATAATATVTGGAAATGASAAALPDSNDADAALIMAGTLLALTAMAAYVLLRASAKERHHHDS